MSSFEFSPAMRLALDAYRVPPLPEDFAERVVAKALATSRQRAPAPQRTSRWRKAGRIATGAALAGLLTATAAAAGWLGKPVYVPVISEIIERIAPRPVETVVPAQDSQATIAPLTDAAPALSPAIELSPPVLLPPPQPATPAIPTGTQAQPPAAAAAPSPPTQAPAAIPVERVEPLRNPLPLTPQREASPAQVAEPVTAPTRAALDTVTPTEPAIRTEPLPTRTLAPVPPEVRPAERLRTPIAPRTPRPTPPTDLRRQLRDRRTP